MSIKRHKNESQSVVNYLFELAILDADSVGLEWIHRKSRTGIDIGESEAWKKWIQDG